LVIHRAFEKIAENRPFTKIPLTDHELLLLPINNMGWWMTLEKLDVEVPVRNIYELL
jgi:NADH-quinone oxidoreductase subunit D